MNPDHNIAPPDEDWEEWDGRSPFLVHCAAGSLAGVVEHTAVYPLDTVRTHIQVCAACLQRGAAGPLHNNKRTATTTTTMRGSNALLSNRMIPNPTKLPTSMWQTIRSLVHEPAMAAAAANNNAAAAAVSTGTSHAATENTVAESMNIILGWTRLWRGVQTVLLGCVPAHALYFSSYEAVKALNCTPEGQITAIGSSLAGAAAVFTHDCIMTPLDTLKQRMQLGYHQQDRVFNALHSIGKQEGYAALYRSFPITLATNIPYGMVMVTTNEYCKQVLGAHWDAPHQHGRSPSLKTVLVSSSLAGLVASAVTTPLDRIKTALQTQELTPVCYLQQPPPANCPRTAMNTTTISSSSMANATTPTAAVLRHSTWQQAARHIYETEGATGFTRGMVPRVLAHTSAVAISWTTYETVKQYLLTKYSYE